MALNERDRRILRDLAKEVADIAAGDNADEKIALWKAVNRLERVRPPVYCVITAQGWTEVVSEASLECEDDWARIQEMELRRRVYRGRHLRDDTVFDDLWPVNLAIRGMRWSLEFAADRPLVDRGAMRYKAVIENEADIEKIRPFEIEHDEAATRRAVERAEEVFGDILRVHPQPMARHAMHLVDDLIKWRGIEQTFLDLMERPKWVHEVLDRMARFVHDQLDQLEAGGLLAPNNGNVRNGSGGWAWTDELPRPDHQPGRTRTTDMWTHATTQIFSEISPAMHDEFGITYERPYMERFGLSNYGCCEPLHHKIDILRPIRGLRRVSMSPWVDAAKGAEAVGADYVYSYKPNPATIAADTWDPEVARAELRRVFDVTRDCVVEIVMKDTQTCRDEPRRFEAWTDLAREEAEKAV